MASTELRRQPTLPQPSALRKGLTTDHAQADQMQPPLSSPLPRTEALLHRASARPGAWSGRCRPQPLRGRTDSAAAVGRAIAPDGQQQRVGATEVLAARAVAPPGAAWS